MKILTNKQYQDLLNQITNHEKNNLGILARNAELVHQLKEAKDFKELLKEIISKTGIPAPDTKGGYLYVVDNSFGVPNTSWNTEIVLPDTVLQYTDDILGGKVIKQEGNKCLVIAKDGTVKTGLTNAKVDKGYTYKLVRE